MVTEYELLSVLQASCHSLAPAPTARAHIPQEGMTARKEKLPLGCDLILRTLSNHSALSALRDLFFAAALGSQLTCLLS